MPTVEILSAIQHLCDVVLKREMIRPSGAPVVPQIRQAESKQANSATKPKSIRGTLQDQQLLAQGEIFRHRKSRGNKQIAEYVVERIKDKHWRIASSQKWDLRAASSVP